ncbi:hypothetical protein PVAP13_7KG368000 [Panicum virgatum]|uniref:Uncharacterized protein n=1 Tax=Panicum virgatum TaxID=38727 RepID=A0A8T0QRV9_PANVG|nr:hypothetical protein PVAP13_7KG368000 [Panicum virgatum]
MHAPRRPNRPHTNFYILFRLGSVSSQAIHVRKNWTVPTISDGIDRFTASTTPVSPHPSPHPSFAITVKNIPASRPFFSPGGQPALVAGGHGVGKVAPASARRQTRRQLAAALVVAARQPASSARLRIVSPSPVRPRHALVVAARQLASSSTRCLAVPRGVVRLRRAQEAEARLSDVPLTTPFTITSLRLETVSNITTSSSAAAPLAKGRLTSTFHPAPGRIEGTHRLASGQPWPWLTLGIPTQCELASSREY